MEGVALKHFNKFKPFTINMAQFHYHLFYGSDQHDRTNTTHLCVIIQFLLTK